MNVIVCGANGYIGSVLTPELCRLGLHVNVTAADLKLGSSLRDACRYDNLEIVQANCLDGKVVGQLVKKADFIYWLVGATAGDEKTLRDVNVGSATLLAKSISKSQTIVFSQTNAGYQPTSGIATEETPMIGGSVYSKTKIEAEKILMDTGRCVSFRLAAIYGPAPTIRWETLLNYMVYHAVKHPSRSFEIFQPYVVRDVLFTTDLVQRLLFATYVNLAGEIFNLSGQSMSKSSFLERVFNHEALRGLRRSFSIVQGSDLDQRNFQVSEEKFKRQFQSHQGAPPVTTDLDDGIEATIKAARLEG